MKEYIVHGTQPENLIHILQDGYIDTKPPKKNRTMLKNKPPNQIFTQLVYKDIPNQKEQIQHWFSCAIILDKKILKDYPFYSTGVGSFRDKFDNGIHNENSIIHGEGNLTRMPNLTKLKNKINKKMENNFLGNVEFMHTHEILFNHKIPLDTYCIKILIIGNHFTNAKDKKIMEKIIDLGKEKNIMIQFRDYKNMDKNEPINSFINSIESI
jgi:hypothetical protein